MLCTDLGAVACRSDRSSGGVVSNQHCARASCDALAEGQQITSRVGLGGRADAKGEYRHGHTAIAAGGHAAGTQRAVVVAQGVDDATLAYAGAGRGRACLLPASVTCACRTILAAFMRPARPTFAFLGGARLGKSVANTPLLQAKTEKSLSRALLVPEGVPRAPSL